MPTNRRNITMIKTEVKMEVTNEAQFYALQDLLFNNGLYWGITGSNKSKATCSYSKYHIFVYKRGFTREANLYNSDVEYFNDHSHTEVDIDLYLKTKGTCIISPLKRKKLT